MKLLIRVLDCLCSESCLDWVPVATSDNTPVISLEWWVSSNPPLATEFISNLHCDHLDCGVWLKGFSPLS